METITKEEFQAIAKADGNVAIPCATTEPPMTLIFKKESIGKNPIARAKWYDGTAYHDGKQPEFVTLP